MKRKIMAMILPWMLSVSALPDTALQGQKPPSSGVQNQNRVIGKWLGKLLINPGKMEPRVGLEIFQDKDGKLQALCHFVDDGDITRMNSASINGNNLRIERKQFCLIIEGSLEGDGKTIQAKWLQRGKTFPLLLQRVDSLPVLSKPQTPKAPFPYLEEEVCYRNNEAGIWLAGTLTLPKGKGPFPAALLLAGSGERDRDSSYSRHRPFMVLADYLTRHGYAVLRADKRGCGKSGGVYLDGDVAGFASDALAGVEYLQSRIEVNSKRITLMGHSEGGSVAPLAASRSKSIASMVLLAAPGMPDIDLLILQDGTEAQAKKGASEADMALIRGYSRRFYDQVQNTKDQEELVQKTKALQAGLSEAEKKALGNPRGTLSLEWVLANPSFKEYLRFDVCPLLRALKCPVLALNGSKDCQVPSRENLTGIARELIAGGNLNFTIRELPNLNHLLQTCRTGATDEYAKIEETLSPKVIQAIVDWMNMGWEL